MRILVTGREGQVARSLVERAAGRKDLTLIALGRPHLDLEKPETIGLAIADARPDLVINAAAYTQVDQAEEEPERAFRVNGEAAGDVAAAAATLGVPIIHLSTDYVFDGRLDRPYREDDPVNPLGVYGRSKLEGEERVRAANSDHAIVRTAWVYSPFGRNFVKTMMTAAHTRDELNVVADQVGNPTSALDLADGLLAMAEQWRGSGTWHLAGTGDASWHEFAEAIMSACREAGEPSARIAPIRTQEWPTKAVRPANSRLSSARFEADFGFAMPDWRASVLDVVMRVAKERPA